MEKPICTSSPASMKDAIFIPYEPNKGLDPRIRQIINQRAASRRRQSRSNINHASTQYQSTSRRLEKSVVHGRPEQQPFPVNSDSSNTFLWRDRSGMVSSPQTSLFRMPTLISQDSRTDERRVIDPGNSLNAANDPSMMPILSGGTRNASNTIIYPPYESMAQMDPNWVLGPANMYHLGAAEEADMYSNPAEATSLLEAPLIVFDWHVSTDQAGMAYQRYY